MFAVRNTVQIDAPIVRNATRCGFFMAGFGLSVWAPLVPYVRERIEMTDAVFGLLLLCIGIGSLTWMPISGVLVARWGIRPVQLCSVALLALALAGMALTDSIGWLGLALFCFGGSLGVIDVIMNIQAVLVETAVGRRLMSNFHGMYSLGAISGALVLTGLLQGSDALQRQGVLAGLWLVAALMALIGGRVIPFFTQRGLGKLEAVKPWVWLDVALLVGTGVIALLHAFGLAMRPQPLLGLLFAAIGVGHLLRLARWYDKGIWKVGLLWSLHVAMLWMVVATFGLALWHFGLLAQSSPALHALTVGSMSGLILAMIARVTLGHTGRPLQLPAGIVGAFVLFNLGTASRVFLSVAWPVTGLWLAAICWALAFALYVWRYAPMLLAPRVDGHPG